jgi:hypothetical protein
MVPQESGRTADSAAIRARAVGLVPSFVTRPSPGHTPGLVYKQSPNAGSTAKSGESHHVLHRGSAGVAHHYRASGAADKSTEIFRIRGSRWRINYTITNNTCAYGQCIGPTVDVTGDGGFYSFDLHAASAFTNVPLPAGRYSAQVNVISGSPQYTLTVQDYY